MAAPVDPLTALQCHCITFYTLSEPTPCDVPGALNLDWEVAQSMASFHDLKIQFASRSTVTKVLEADQPLPTRVLLSITDGEEVESVGSRIVCGTGDEVRLKYLKDYDSSEAHGYDMFATKVVAVLLLLVILYAAGEYLWERYSDRGGRIKLKGDEKDLAAHSRQKKRSSPEPSHKG